MAKIERLEMIKIEDVEKIIRDYFIDKLNNGVYTVDCVDCNSELIQLIEKHKNNNNDFIMNRFMRKE